MFRFRVVPCDGVLDGGDELGNVSESVAANAFVGQVAEEAFTMRMLNGLVWGCQSRWRKGGLWWLATTFSPVGIRFSSLMMVTDHAQSGKRFPHLLST